MRTRLTSRLSLLFVSFALVLALPAIALADQLANAVDDSLDGTFEEMALETGGKTQETLIYVVPVDGDGGSGLCNFDAAGDKATVTVASNATSVATAKWKANNTASIDFTGCGQANGKTLAVTSGSAASEASQTDTINPANITFSTVDSFGRGSLSTNFAQFKVLTSAPAPSNTPPSVSVTGVEAGASYEKGSVPAAGCSVTDAEDTNESAPPVFDNSGLDSNGLGPVMVTCSYTDGGNPPLTETASATYTIQDTTAPVIAAHADVTKEATGPNGVLVNYTNPTANDAVYGSVNVDCAPVSGSQFELGSTTVTCNATDGSGNKAVATTFNVIVKDTTAPTLTVPSAPVVVEATGPTGAVATYQVTAKDAVDSSPSISCTPESGNVFVLGTTQVTCAAKDAAGNTSAEKSFDVTVRDTTAPKLNLPENKIVEATGPNGAAVTFARTASDIVDGAVSVNCFVGTTPVSSGDTFALGITTVDCSATDRAGNKASDSFTVTVQDTTAPKLNLPANITEEATGPNGNVVNYSTSASDLVSGNVNVTCTPASGSIFGINNTTATTVNCSAKDAAGNEATGSFAVKVQDTIAPNNIQFGGNISDGDSFFFGDVPAQPTCSATDSGSGLNAAGCVVTGYKTTVGTHTLTATATDKAGNTATKTLAYTVKPYTLNGFYQPIDMNGTVNTVKNGSTVPVKFELFKGTTELTSTSAVTSILARPMNCGELTGDPEDPIETLATGGTSLRYDATAGQFIYNWTTPKGATQVGKCYSLTMTAADSSTITAYFKLK